MPYVTFVANDGLGSPEQVEQVGQGVRGVEKSETCWRRVVQELINDNSSNNMRKLRIRNVYAAYTHCVYAMRVAAAVAAWPKTQQQQKKNGIRTQRHVVYVRI